MIIMVLSSELIVCPFSNSLANDRVSTFSSFVCSNCDFNSEAALVPGIGSAIPFASSIFSDCLLLLLSYFQFVLIFF